MGMKETIFPIASIIGVFVFTVLNGIEEGITLTGHISLLLLFLGLSLMLIGIFRDRFRQPKPMLNLGFIYAGGVITVISVVALCFVSQTFENWAAYIIIPVVFGLCLIYGLVLFGKDKYLPELQ